MSTEPKPRPPEETRKRQSTYLIGAALVIAAVTTGIVLMDRSGAAREENRGRTNETHSQEPTVPSNAR